jgi:hypothetical protein
MYKFLAGIVLVATSFASNDAGAEFKVLEGIASYQEKMAFGPVYMCRFKASIHCKR